MPRHPNKAIRAAVEHALSNGWRLEKCAPRAHCWGRLYCPGAARGACIVTVYGTPKNPEAHARRILRDVDACQHSVSP